jgi:hypothetical protein
VLRKGVHQVFQLHTHYLTCVQSETIALIAFNANGIILTGKREVCSGLATGTGNTVSVCPGTGEKKAPFWGTVSQCEESVWSV